MLHGQFSSAELNAGQSGDTVRVSVPETGTAGSVTIPDTELLFSAKFTQSGSDLVLTGTDGHKVIVTGYFDHEDRAALVAPGGASLSADLVAKLTISQTPMQFAQAGAPAGGVVIGHVDRLGGRATVQHANGSVEELRVGDNIYQGDVVKTSGGSTLGLGLNDGTAFNMGANARMVLNELVYDSASNSNSGIFSLVKGSITFVAGQVAKTGDMRVETPVATMGIRGTTVNTSISADIGGNIVSVTYSLMADPDGHVGSFNLLDKTTGAIIGTITATDTMFVITPTANLGVLAQQLDKTPEQVQIELGVAQVLFPIFLSNPANFLTNPNPNNINPNDLQPQKGTHGSGGYLEYHGHSSEFGDVDFLHPRGLTIAETVYIQVLTPDGITQTTTQTIPVMLPTNLSPLVNVDTPAHLVESAGFDFGVRTSTANVTKSDIDGTASYDTAALLADQWIDLGNGIYSKLGNYGAATLNTLGVSGSALTSSGWFYVGTGVYQKFGVDFGAGNFETVRVKLGADTLTYALDNFKANGLSDSDHPTENFVIRVVDNQGAQGSTTATFAIDGANDDPYFISGYGPFAHYTVSEGTRYVTTVKAQDPEGDALTYSLAPGGFDSFYLKIDPVTGVLAFKTAPDFEFPHDHFHNNTYFVDVIADDGHGGTSTQHIGIDVSNLQREVFGNSGDDILNGLSNRTNYLSGGGGNDILNGANRSDVFVGGSGNDMMTGNGGIRDTFVFNPNFGKDTIVDFRTASDLIEIDHSLFADFADLIAQTTDVAGDAVITFDANNAITLSGVLKANLTQNDFHFV